MQTDKLTLQHPPAEPTAGLLSAASTSQAAVSASQAKSFIASAFVATNQVREMGKLPTRITKAPESKINLASFQLEEEAQAAISPLPAFPNTPAGPAPAENPFSPDNRPSPEEPVVSEQLSAPSSLPDNFVSLQQVLTSVTSCYPEIEIAIGEIESARGKVLATWGEFDSVFAAHSISQPLGFYQTYRNGVGLNRPLYGGGEVYGTYRIGDGNFEPWYGERETNEGGEFKAGFSVPLLKDRIIDKRRADVRSAQLDQNQVEANVESRLLQFERFATQAYWDWAASGQAVQIQQELLDLAEQRVDQINVRIEEGDLATISKIDNDRFIAKRRNSLIKARRSLEKSAIKLSLFLRDENCIPVIAGVDQLPTDFPAAQQITDSQSAADIELALRCRPELVELQAAREQACVYVQYAKNLLLPKLDIKGFAGQDIGGETSSLGDKTPFELQLGVFAEVPIQRREGAGKLQAAQGKIAQIDAKCQFVTDKIRAEIQDSTSAVNAAAEQIEQSQETVRLNEESLELGRLSFEEGDIDLLDLNIYESSVADARLQLLEAQFKYFSSLAAYKAITNCQAFITKNEIVN